MKRILGLMYVWLSVVSMASAVPNSITYQGTLRKNRALVTEKLDMKFEILNGGQSVWTQVIPQVPVENGVFSVVLTPTVDWENIDAYIQITIGKEVMGPPEKLQANPYSLVAKTVASGAISREKLNSDVRGYLLPAGAIVAFAGSCPTGWTRYSAGDGKFIMGADPASVAPGTTGGAASHSHPITSDGQHSHGNQTSNANRRSPKIVSTPAGATGGAYLEDVANQFTERASEHAHTVSDDGQHNHSGSTSATSSLPPYVALVYCQKS